MSKLPTPEINPCEDSLISRSNTCDTVAAQRLTALSRWENEGGNPRAAEPEAPADTPGMTHAEIVLLRVRVISPENLLIAVLSGGTDRQMQAARDMAAVIAPRPDVTQHSLTIRASQHMNDIVDRAVHMRGILS